MSIISNLYPPLIANSQPAFVRTNTCKIYFSLSVYNSIDNIANVQISLINQKTNTSALINSSGIKIAALQEDSSIQHNYKYYVEISPSDLKDGVFGLNQFYKVQLRFTATTAAEIEDETKLATWLAENTASFSEWSTICLIKGIEQPKISIHNLEDSDITLTSSIIDIVGKMYFDNINEQEYLKNYQIQLYDKGSLLIDSGVVYTNQFNPNEFNYELELQLTTGSNYTLNFIFTTINGYTETKIYNFSILEPKIDKLNVDILAVADNQNGRAKISIKTRDSSIFIGNLTIRRTSSETNFHKWEDVKNFIFNSNEPLNFTWYDYTVESGIWYKYCVQKKNYNGDRGAITATAIPIMCEFEDIFLVGNNRQLKIQFNPSLNEFKYNVTESQQVTLGGKFPFIKRNGNNYYRSFPIGGLISSFSDIADWNNTYNTNASEIKIFTSKDKIYKDYKDLYKNYNLQNNINSYQDRIYERKFREEVYKFLYENNAKLFKSTTEGNILIRLTNIDFQPVESLGRRIYSFTATAIEIDEPNIYNYNYYEIQTIGDINKNKINYQYETLGQYYGNTGTTEFLTNALQVKYAGRAKVGYTSSVNKLKWIKIEIYSEPYVIIEDNGELIKAASDSSINSNAIVGYIVEINGVETIIKNTLQRYSNYSSNLTNNQYYINSVGCFELSNIEITSLKFKYNVNACIDYLAVIEEVENSPTIEKIEYFNKIGQLYKTFSPADSVMSIIYDKYYCSYSAYVQKLVDINSICIQGPVGSIVYIKDSNNSTFNKYILQTGYLELKNNEVSIEGIYFYGVHLNKKESLEIAAAARENEFIEILDNNYTNLSDIENPIPNGVYQLQNFAVNNSSPVLAISPSNVLQNSDLNYFSLLQQTQINNSNKYIFYHGKWYPFTKDDDVICEVDGIIDYYAAIARTVYLS